MIAEVHQCGSEEKIAAKAVDNFPLIFTQRSRKANREKARKWYKFRNEFLQELESSANKPMSIVSRRISGPAVRRFSIKALYGRGIKRAFWKNILHQILRDEFLRFRSAGVKISRSFLQEASLALVNNPTVPVTQQEIELDTGKSIHECLNMRFIDDFCDRFCIVTRKRTGNKSLGPEQIARNNRYIAFHLGELKRSYDNGENPNTVENFDETHMIIDSENGHVLDFQGKKNVTYAEVSSGRDCFTICFRISGQGPGKIEKPLVIFQNPGSNYPIIGLHDNVQNVTYRSSQSGWMNSSLFARYFQDPTIMGALSSGLTRKLWIDSCRIHRSTPELIEAAESVNTQLMRFQPNCTSIAQPLDQLVLRSFKAEWRKKWEKKRNELVLQNNFTSTGRARNPGKQFFLQLVGAVVAEMNERVENGMTMAKKSLIKCGLIPSSDGSWRTDQLTPQLQHIIESNVEYFDGRDPST